MLNDVYNVLSPIAFNTPIRVKGDPTFGDCQLWFDHVTLKRDGYKDVNIKDVYVSQYLKTEMTFTGHFINQMCVCIQYDVKNDPKTIIDTYVGGRLSSKRIQHGDKAVFSSHIHQVNALLKFCIDAYQDERKRQAALIWEVLENE